MTPRPRPGLRWAFLRPVLACVLTAGLTLSGPAGAVTVAGGGAPPSRALAAEVTATPQPTSTPEPTITPEPTTTPEPTPSVGVPAITVTAVGDLCFDSSVRRLIASKGPKAPFGKVRKVLVKSDVTVGNLECPLSTKGSPVPGKTFTFEGPPKAAKGLKWAGFDLLAMGNNHARDYGPAALAGTLVHLDRAKIAHAGAGKTSKSAFKATYITRDGAKIAFLSYSQIGPANFRAGTHRSGTAYTTSLRAVTRAIKRANRKADYVIVSFHWGIERQHTPTATQVRFGRAAIRAGANAVLSHHPHVIQGVEFYKKGIIAYSLGNFVFSPGSDEGHDTMILSMTLGRKGVRNVIARPAHIDPYGRPRLATGSTRARILGKIKSTSRGRGTHVKISNGVAKLRK